MTFFRPEFTFESSGRSWPSQRAAQPPKGRSPSSLKNPSSFVKISKSPSLMIATGFRLRNHHVFGGTRANTPRPRSTVRARTYTRSSTRRSAFPANPLHKHGSRRRRTPGAHQRDSFSCRSPLCSYHTQVLLAARGRFRSIWRKRH